MLISHLQIMRARSRAVAVGNVVKMACMKNNCVRWTVERLNCVSRQRAPCLLSIVIAASCALLFAIATDELFNGLNSNGEIAVALCVESPVLLNIWEFPHRSRQSSYHTQFILTNWESEFVSYVLTT
jgi:hypothetical protein